MIATTAPQHDLASKLAARKKKKAMESLQTHRKFVQQCSEQKSGDTSAELEALDGLKLPVECAAEDAEVLREYRDPTLICLEVTAPDGSRRPFFTNPERFVAEHDKIMADEDKEMKNLNLEIKAIDERRHKAVCRLRSIENMRQQAFAMRRTVALFVRLNPRVLSDDLDRAAAHTGPAVPFEKAEQINSAPGDPGNGFFLRAKHLSSQ